jgi:hypothetical protein
VGIFNKVVDLAKQGADIAKEAIVDKDKLVDLKAKLQELVEEANKADIESARSMYTAETQDTNKFRSLQRPLWSFICLFGFLLQVGSIVVAWMLQLFGKQPTITLVYPLPVNAIIISVVTFYFGGRYFERQNVTNKFFEKWGI